MKRGPFLLMMTLMVGTGAEVGLWYGQHHRPSSPAAAVIEALLLYGLDLGIGVILGAACLARWYIAHTNKPEVAREMLKGLYRKSHPHWLQVSADDPTRVCPCCGWSETEGLVVETGVSRPEKPTGGEQAG